MKVFSYQTLKEAQKNISEKNWNSFFSRIAKTFHKGSPVELGIFYYFKGKIYKSSKPWNDENIFKKERCFEFFVLKHLAGSECLLIDDTVRHKNIRILEKGLSTRIAFVPANTEKELQLSLSLWR